MQPHIVAQMLVATCLLLSCSSAAAQPAVDYIVGAQDVLTITLWDQPDVSGKFSVETDGTFTFPMIGRVHAAGMRLRDLEGELKRRLADGYFKNPQVSVAVEHYRSQRIFIVGEVRNPGTYPLTGDMTLIEALAHAGSVTADASSEAVLIRPRSRRAEGPALSEQSDAEVLRLDLRQLESGSLAQNVTLRDGDTIFISRVETVFVFGQVRMPGAYPIRKDTTVLQALSLAGGVTDRGSTGRVKVVRTVNGQRNEMKAKLNDFLQPGDTIIVLERFF